MFPPTSVPYAETRCPNPTQFAKPIACSGSSLSLAPKLDHKLKSNVKQFTQPVEGQNEGQETAATHGGLQVSDSQLSSEHEIHAGLISALKRYPLDNEARVY